MNCLKLFLHQALKHVVSNKSTKADRDFSISRMISREDLQIHLGQIHQDIADTAPSSPADFGDSGKFSKYLSPCVEDLLSPLQIMVQFFSFER